MSTKATSMRDDARVWMLGGFLALCVGMMLSTLFFIVWRGGSAFWPKAIEVILFDQVDSPGLVVGQRLSQDAQSVRIQTSDPGFGTSRSTAVGLEQWKESHRVQSGWIQRLETRQSGALFSIPLSVTTLEDQPSSGVSEAARRVILDIASRWKSDQASSPQAGKGDAARSIATNLEESVRPAVRREQIGSKGDLSVFLRRAKQYQKRASSSRDALVTADEQIADSLSDLNPRIANQWLLLAQEEAVTSRFLAAIEEAQEFASRLRTWTQEQKETIDRQFAEYRSELQTRQSAQARQFDEFTKEIALAGEVDFSGKSRGAFLTAVSKRHKIELELSWADSLLAEQQLEFASTTRVESVELPLDAIARINAIQRETNLSDEELKIVRDYWSLEGLDGATDARISSDATSEGVQLLRLDSSKESQVAILFSGKNDFLFPLRKESVPLSDVEAVFAVNRMSMWETTRVYIGRWAEFLTAAPRAANTAGGIFPAIWGTVVLTVIMSLAVIPLGVVAALYLREYVTASPLVSLVRISIHNLAGVPSVVYGVFGVAFFCYALGAFLDGGPTNAGIEILPAPNWFIGMGATATISCVAFFFSIQIGHGASVRRLWLPRLALLLWTMSLVGFCFLLLKSPFFEGFYRDSLPIPTFGKGGILWASLTLALLTLPIVIVSTEEALAMVPNSLRVGSFACGASKWQTIWNIVLPYAKSGIVTGGVLAAARSVGQVAPLMLVGALPAVTDLPLDSQFPFLHPSRSFMHLGNQVYSLSQRSSDTEATQPMVFASILLLVLVVASLHLTANLIRARFRARFAQH